METNKPQNEKNDCAKNGCQFFSAGQTCYHDVIVDKNNNVMRDTGIFEAQRPHGPYICNDCGKEYKQLPE